MGGKSGKQTIGYKYFLSVKMILCQGPIDAITEVIVGERSAWTGSQTTSGDVYINAPDLFGGDSREGGVQGTMTVSMGDSLTQDPYLVSQLGPHVPAFLNKCCLIFKDFMWSEINPYFKSPWIRGTRIFAGWYKNVVWYPSKAVINSLDMNPAHMIYQSITDPRWGMGYSSDDIDDLNFKAAADTLYTEGFGLSMIWDQNLTIEEFIQNICDHINASWDLDISTGKFKLKLIRNNYVLADLLQLDRTHVSDVSSFQRAGWGEQANQVIVKYLDRDQNDASVSQENIAAIDAEGAVIPTTKEYLGIRTEALALRVCARDLKTSSSCLAKLSLTTDRILWSKVAGDVIAVVLPELGILQVAFRIVSIDKGTLTSGQISVDLVEDVFGLPSSTYTVPQAGGWIDPIQPPSPVVAPIAVEAPYWDIVRNMSAADFNNLTPGYAFGEVIAVAPSAVNYGFELWEAPNTISYEFADNGEFAPTGTLSTNLDYTTGLVTLSNKNSLDSVNVGSYAIVDGEYVSVLTVNPISGVVTFGRGVLDTVPKKHNAGSRVYFAENNLGHDPTEYAIGITEHYKALTRTPLGILPLASASDLPLSFIGRAELPYPPGNFRINAVNYPGSISGQVTVAWSHRNRLSQTVSLIPYSVGDITPEPDVTYKLKIMGETATIINESDIVSTSRSITIDEEKAISNVVDYGTTREIRTFGFALLTTPLSIAMNNPFVYAPVNKAGGFVTTLLHFDGTNGSTTITDDSISGHAYTAAGNAQISTTESRFGGSSLYLDGSGDWVSTTTGLSDYIFGTGDFTAECWIKTTASNTVILDFFGGGSGWQVGVNPGGTLNFYCTSSIMNSSASVSDGAWHHIATVRNAGILKFYIDGVTSASVSFGTNLVSSTSVFAIGAQVFSRNSTYDYTGYIDDVRIVKGTAVYTADFTPPSAPLSNSVGATLESAWMGLNFASGARYLDMVGNATLKDFNSTDHTDLNGPVNIFSLQPGVYRSMVFPDSYIGWGIAIDGSSGGAYIPNSEFGASNKLIDAVIDRRTNRTQSFYMCMRHSILVYFPQSRSAPRRIYKFNPYLLCIQNSDVTLGNLPLNRISLAEAYTGELAQFNNFTGTYLAAPLSPFYYLQGPFNGIIFGSLMYISYQDAGSTINTVGKTIDITNILTSHVDISATLVAKTRVYNITDSGALTLLTTRNGVFLADQVNSTYGVEIVGNNIFTVNMTTGAQVTFIATLPSPPAGICGDVPNGMFYVVCENSYIYKYDVTGALQASLLIAPPNYYSGPISAKIKISSNRVYIDRLKEVDKSLTSLKTRNGTNGVLNIYSSDPSSSVSYVNWKTTAGVVSNSLADDAGLGDEVFNGPTARLNDTITVELSSLRGVSESYTKHNFTTKRQGMGLRMGESMGG